MTTCIDRAWLERHADVLAWVGSVKVRHPVDRAHPYPPGSGPRGQSCGTCAKLSSRKFNKKTYFKCHVLMRFWTGGKGTDVRKKDPACLSWEPRIELVEPITTLTRGRVGQYPEAGSRQYRRMRRGG
jgi:hypothetical protein